MFNTNMKSQNSKKGISVYLTLMIMIIILAIGLGISTIIVSQIKMIRGIGDSVAAIYAADTGIERVLYEDELCRQSGCGTLCLNQTSCDSGIAKCLRDEGCTFSDNVGSSNYQVNFNDGATLIQSVGIYKDTKRSIEVTR